MEQTFIDLEYDLLRENPLPMVDHNEDLKKKKDGEDVETGKTKSDNTKKKKKKKKEKPMNKKKKKIKKKEKTRLIPTWTIRSSRNYSKRNKPSDRPPAPPPSLFSSYPNE